MIHFARLRNALLIGGPCKDGVRHDRGGMGCWCSPRSIERGDDRTQARLVPRVLREGRGREMVADLAREVGSWGSELTIGTQSPAYSLTPGGLEQLAPTPLVFTPIPSRLRGWCLAPDFRSAIGWNRHSIFDVAVAHHPFTFVTTKLPRFDRRITAVHRLASGDILVCLVGSVCLYSRQEAKLVEVLALSYAKELRQAPESRRGRPRSTDHRGVRQRQGRPREMDLNRVDLLVRRSGALVAELGCADSSRSQQTCPRCGSVPRIWAAFRHDR